MKTKNLFSIVSLSLLSTVVISQQVKASESTPNLTIGNPSGYGADANTIYLNADYQNKTRGTNTSDGELGIGVGLGDSVKAVGVDLNYTINSFGSNNNGGKFGEGGLSAKLHKKLGDDASIAIGWNQFATVGTSDYPSNSYYVSGTKILVTKEDINQPLSRVAITAGVGGGVFNKYQPDLNNRQPTSGVSPFASVAIRVTKPLSAIIEYSGESLSAGVSVVPVDNFPLTVTPVVRDITGNNGGARFSVGVSTSFKF